MEQQHLKKSIDIANRLQQCYDFIIRIIDNPLPKLQNLANLILTQAKEEGVSALTIVIRAMQNAKKDSNESYITWFAAAYVHLTNTNETSSNL